MFALRLLLALAVVPLAVPLDAQLPPLTVPKGLVRFDIGGSFDFWDQAYLAGVKQDAASDFIRDPVTGSWLPGLGQAEAVLRRATGSQAIALSLGKTSSNLSVNIVTAGIGASYGVTSRITLFGKVPIVRVRAQQRFALDSTGATAGFNPADPLFGNAEGAGTTSTFMSTLSSALLSLDAQIRAGTFTNNPAELAEAEAILARGTALRSDLETLLFESAFLPIEGTPAAQALTQTIDSIRTRLQALIVPIPLSGSPALPTGGVSSSGFENYLTRPDGTIQAQPFDPPILRTVGDIEVGAAVALLNPSPPSRGFALRSVLQGTVRLRTGTIDDPNALFDLGTGDRQPDIQGDLVTDLMGSRFGARLTARYVVQLPGRLERRLTPPDRPITPASTLAAVERDPGEIMEGAFEPYVRLARNFSFVAGVRHWRKGEDKYSYVPGQDSIPDTTPDVLAQGSKENGTMLSAGFSFSHGGVRRDGRTGLPLDATVRGEVVIGSTEGRVPAKRSVVFLMRLYGKIF